jgi:hypothetical protein
MVVKEMKQKYVESLSVQPSHALNTTAPKMIYVIITHKVTIIGTAI